MGKAPKVTTVLDQTRFQDFWYIKMSTEALFRALLRICQVATAATVAGIYGADLVYQHSLENVASTRWIYAEVVAALSLLTCTGYGLLNTSSAWWALWDFVLSVLWAACAGVFWTIFITHDNISKPEYYGTLSITNMRAAIAFDVLSLAFWLLSCLQSLLWCCRIRTRRSSRQADHRLLSSNCEVPFDRANIEESDAPPPYPSTEHFLKDEKPQLEEHDRKP